MSLLLIGCAKDTVKPDMKAEQTSSAQNAKDDMGEFDDFDSEYQTKDQSDPLEGYNRFMTDFNDKVYIHVLEPVASGYAAVVPEGGRVALKNFIDNLKTPVRFANNILQFKFKEASREVGRFTVNTIFGLGGFFDPAQTELGWERSNEDFGQTLGAYGIGAGPHIVLPLLGPSNVRDSIGLAGDAFISPLASYFDNTLKYKIPENAMQNIGIKGVEVVNDTSLRPGQYESIKKDALDLYPFLRDSYDQLREKEIKE